MKNIPFSILNDTVFAFDCISAITLIPQKQFLSHMKLGRILNGFLYMLEGECVFSFEGEKVFCTPGTLIYLPTGSKHTYTALTESIKYIRVDFRMIDVSSSEEMVLTKHPYVIYDNAPFYASSLIEQLSDIFMTHTNGEKLKSKSILYDLMSHICFDLSNNSDKNSDIFKITAAINYIEKNFTKNISTAYLADMCNLSPSHFRRIFKKCKGCTPTEYKNTIRVEKAKSLLGNGELTITEISDRLGFESVYYFSRVFKEKVGVSAKEFRSTY